MIRERITPFQLGCLCFSFLSGFSTLYLLEAKLLMQDVWIANLTACLFILMLLKMNAYVQNQYPHANMSDIIDIVLGKWLGKLAHAFYLLGMLGLGVLSLRSISVFYTSAILPGTSPNLIMLLVVIVTTYAASLGLSTIARSVLVILPFFVVSIVAIGFFIYQDVEANPFMPQLQHPLPLLLYGSLISFGFPFCKSYVMVFLFSEVTHQKKLFKSCSIAVVFSCAYLLIATYLTIGSLGDNMFKTAMFPFFSSIQLVKFGEYIERIEILIIAIWTIMTMYEIIVLQYVFVQIAGRLFGMKALKPFYLPVGVFFFAVATKSFVNPAELVAYDLKILPVSVNLNAVLVPVCVFVLTLFKKRGGSVQELNHS
ncbi:GerAB/ArcD/ProY family transporter [Paenibacillus glycinis]|uniref:Endospore germination permease n=1 Tax=Paenibacillus glycinis TaxID=2697035 RepID=A0ABW9XKS5_9BACL|nr:endospore germination permease [Paenibacillus glycinis]NBD23206.1 endospore germination permease [Paenibacillus glycinis]